MKYLRPSALTESLEFLSGHGTETEILAGSTDVMVDLRAGELAGRKFLLDVSRLPELSGIRVRDGRLIIGAGVTLTGIQQSRLIRDLAPALHRCSESFASRQVRNRATIGGNVAQASPCGDTIPPLVIHKAMADLRTADREYLIPVEEIASDPYRSSLPPDAVLVRFILEPAQGRFHDFQKIGRRKELAIARMSLAVMADTDEEGRTSFIRISLGACKPTPSRMRQVEELLINRRPSRDLIRAGARLLAETMIGITGRRSSAVYKEPAVQGLFMRILYPMVHG